jgi:type IV pilus assembly protein PilP
MSTRISILGSQLIRLVFPVFMLVLSGYPVLDVIAEEPDQTPVTGAGQEEVLPDAMRRLPKGPDIDFETLRDPFRSYLAMAAERASQMLMARKAQLASRPREPLEQYDLSELKLVAIFRMGEDRVAMVEDTTGKGFTVRVGNYMGLNNGRVERITDDSLVLLEQVLDPAGDIVDRKVVMTLKEVNQ